MSTFLTTLLALALTAAPPPPHAWVDDAATQLLAKAMVEEARSRGGADARPTPQDLERALARCLDDVDNLMLLSGLMPLRREPEPLKRARPRVISSRDPSAPPDEL